MFLKFISVILVKFAICIAWISFVQDWANLDGLCRRRNLDGLIFV